MGRKNKFDVEGTRREIERAFEEGKTTRKHAWLRVKVRHYLLRQNDRCHWCGRPLGPNRKRRNFGTLEHLVPLGSGGEDALSNLALACRNCNR